MLSRWCYQYLKTGRSISQMQSSESLRTATECLEMMHNRMNSLAGKIENIYVELTPDSGTTKSGKYQVYDGSTQRCLQLIKRFRECIQNPKGVNYPSEFLELKKKLLRAASGPDINELVQAILQAAPIDSHASVNIIQTTLQYLGEHSMSVLFVLAMCVGLYSMDHVSISNWFMQQDTVITHFPQPTEAPSSVVGNVSPAVSAATSSAVIAAATAAAPVIIQKLPLLDFMRMSERLIDSSYSNFLHAFEQLRFTSGNPNPDAVAMEQTLRGGVDNSLPAAEYLEALGRVYPNTPAENWTINLTLGIDKIGDIVRICDTKRYHFPADNPKCAYVARLRETSKELAAKSDSFPPGEYVHMLVDFVVSTNAELFPSTDLIPWGGAATKHLPKASSGLPTEDEVDMNRRIYSGFFGGWWEKVDIDLWTGESLSNTVARVEKEVRSVAPPPPGKYGVILEGLAYLTPEFNNLFESRIVGIRQFNARLASSALALDYQHVKKLNFVQNYADSRVAVSVPDFIRNMQLVQTQIWGDSLTLMYQSIIDNLRTQCAKTVSRGKKTIRVNSMVKSALQTLIPQYKTSLLNLEMCTMHPYNPSSNDDLNSVAKDIIGNLGNAGSDIQCVELNTYEERMVSALIGRPFELHFTLRKKEELSEWMIGKAVNQVFGYIGGDSPLKNLVWDEIRKKATTYTSTVMHDDVCPDTAAWLGGSLRCDMKYLDGKVKPPACPPRAPITPAHFTTDVARGASDARDAVKSPEDGSKALGTGTTGMDSAVEEAAARRARRIARRSMRGDYRPTTGPNGMPLVSMCKLW